jgi:hypothetical protein
MFVLHRSDCVGPPDEDRGVLEEERAKRSELEAHRSVCLVMLEAFGQHRYERGAMPDPFGPMPDANGAAPSIMPTASRRVGSDALVERGDALREGRDAPPVPRAPVLERIRRPR